MSSMLAENKNSEFQELGKRNYNMQNENTEQ